MRERWSQLAAALLLVSALSACSEEREPPAAPASQSAPAAAGAAPLPTESVAAVPSGARSILRPEILVKETAPPPIERTELTVRFDDRSDGLSDAERQHLDALLTTRAMQAGGPITLRGHTDSRGHDGDNLVTSRRRAEAVRDYLARQGVDPERMTVIALGETRPVAPNATLQGEDSPQGRAKNRRVEITVEPPVPEPSMPEPGGTDAASPTTPSPSGSASPGQP